MTRDPRPPRAARPDYTLFLAVLAALGASLVWARGIAWGPGLNPDSLNYVTTAQSLLAGEGFSNARGEPYTQWPPLYPLALAAAAGLCALDPLDVAGPLNAVFFALTVFFAGRWLLRRLQARLPAAWAALALALSLPLADASSWVLSEPLFLLTATLALIEADKFLAAGKARSLPAAAAFAALAWQTRYVGAVLLLFVGLLLLLRRGAPLRRKMLEAAAFAAAAGLPMAPWLLRNYLVEGAPAGIRGAFALALPQTLREIGGGLWAWTHFELPAAAAIALAALGASRLAARGPLTRNRRARPAPPAAARSAALCAGFSLTYLLVLVAAMVSGNAYNRVWPRFLAPLYIPLLFAAAFALERLLSRRRVAGRLAAAAVAAALCLWTAGQAAPHARRIAQANSAEIDLVYNAPRWAESETLRYLRENPLDGMVYSNEPRLLVAMHNPGSAVYRGLYVAADRELLLAGGTPASASAGQERLDARLDAAPHGAWLVWFRNPLRDNLVGYGEAWLRVSPRLERAAELADGVIYRIRAAAAAPPPPVESGAALRAAAASRRVGEPRVEGPGFDVSVRDGNLVYVKQPCTAQDARMRFMLHVYPADKADLPAAQRPHGFANMDFYFPEYGVVLEGGACLARHPLPGYAVERIETGQYTPAEGAAWRAVLRTARPVESGEWRVESGTPSVAGGE